MNNLNYLRHALAIAVLFALGFPATSVAQDAKSPAGSWLYTVTIPIDSNPKDDIVFQGLETYIPGGSYIETDQLAFSPDTLSTPSHGSWAAGQPGHDRDFLLTYYNFSYDSKGNATGKGRVRQTATLSEDGLSYSGSGDFEFTDNDGRVVEAGTFTVTATRIAVEAPATPDAMRLAPLLQQVTTQRRLFRSPR
ncbi:MAG TPA: hypothetical protein VKB88_18245 [Bryobacteraceae bacterium]|nr:hypothetical protein [Bryobacteraceae bacterium]